MRVGSRRSDVKSQACPVTECCSEVAKSSLPSTPKDRHRLLHSLLLRAKRRAATLAQQTGRPPGPPGRAEPHDVPPDSLTLAPPSSFQECDHEYQDHDSECSELEDHVEVCAMPSAAAMTPVPRITSTQSWIVYQLYPHGEPNSITLRDVLDDSG